MSASLASEVPIALRQAQDERKGGQVQHERRGIRAQNNRQGPIRFAGYAAIFDRPDRGGDVIRRGAFARSLGAPRSVPLLWQHDRSRIVGTIEMLGEDRRGLRVIGRVSDEGLVRKSGGLSFGYRVRAGRETDARHRELTDLDLVEISLVAVPMQPLARVHAVAG